MAKPSSGSCWKCEDLTKKHRDLLVVYTPEGHTRIYIFTCNSCYDALKEDELTEYKIKLRNEIKSQLEEY